MDRREMLKLTAGGAVLAAVGDLPDLPDTGKKSYALMSPEPLPQDIFELMQWAEHSYLTDPQIHYAISRATWTLKTTPKREKFTRTALRHLFCLGNVFVRRQDGAIISPFDVEIPHYPDPVYRINNTRVIGEHNFVTSEYLIHRTAPFCRAIRARGWGVPPLAMYGREGLLEKLADPKWVSIGHERADSARTWAGIE